MLNIFGEERFKPLVRFGKEIPEYYVSKEGEIYSSKSNKFMTHTQNFEYYASGRKRLKCLTTACRVPRGFYEDFEHSAGTSTLIQEKYNFTTSKIRIDIHRAVMETWKPIDKYPPESLADEWDSAPECFKQWVRDTAFIDHIDNDPSNNSIDNLRWVTPLQNHYRRKQVEYELK